MSIFSDLRSVVFLRRIARALETIAKTQLTMERLALEREERRVMSRRPLQPQKMVVGMFSQAAASRVWRKNVIESGAMTEEELVDEYGEIPEET